ncbi:efflux RND transporter permease subunit [candidate division KSB1 bacterium]|nr:efflux RND transporter permease subunit [candidate division KSB1 bacterium]
MMRWIVGSSMKLRLVMAAVAALLMVFGFTQLRKMPVDALPEFTRPYVEIQAEALGLSAQEVEAMITTPMEADMINGTPWAEEIRSVSIPGMSSIKLIFERGTDIMKARQVTSERMTEIFALPQVSRPPVMINPVASAGRCMEIGVTSKKHSLIDLSVLARWTIAPRLMGLAGVSNVSIWGERMRQLQVQVDPEKLRASGISLMQVISTAGNSLWASPLTFLEASTPGTGGWIDTPNQRLGVRHILPIQTAEDLAKVPIEGAPSKRLSDIATVVEDHQPLIGDAFINDAASLMLVVEKFPWANTKQVTKDVEKALAALSHGLAGVEMDPTLFRPATFLDLAVNNLSSTLLISTVLMIVALFAFLFNWRTALISTVAVLVSAIVAGGVLYIRGVEANMMIIAGLLIGLAALIDDAIVDVENIARRLRQSRENGSSKSTSTIIYEAVAEMRSPLIYATVIMALAAVPLMFLEGVSGAFWQPVATSYILALLASLAVAVTITPALSLLFLRKGSLQAGDSPIMSALRGLYNGLFGWAARAPRPAFVTACVLALAGLVSIPFLRQESLLPELKETDLVVRMAGTPAASHPAMTRITTLAGRELRSIPGVRNVSSHIGRAIMSDLHTNINASELWVSIDPAADYDATVARIRQVVSGYPGLSPEVLTYSQAKVREELSGTGENLVVRVYGENTDMIRKKAEEVQKMLAKVDGIVDPQVQYPTEMPTLEIEVDIERAKQLGLKPGDVRRAAASLVSGIVVGSLFEEQKVFDVVVWGAPDVRNSVDDVRNLLIDKPHGGYVRLEEVADIRIVPGEAAIHRDAVARRIDVVADVRGRDLASVAADIENGINQISFPLEYRAELLGQYAERLAAQNRVQAFAIAAAIGIFLLLQAYFRSWRLATVVFLTLPMALAGGALAALLTTGGLVSFGAIVGFFAIFGIAVRNTTTLVSRYRHLEREGEEFGAELVQRATQERSGPILLTAVATALVFLPAVFAGNIAGLEIAQPLAVVVIGGLITATIFSLAGVPAMYLLFGAKREPDLDLPITVVTEEEMREAMARVGEMDETKKVIY